jgi:hypothetical protein
MDNYLRILYKYNNFNFACLLNPSLKRRMRRRRWRRTMILKDRWLGTGRFVICQRCPW